MNKNILKLRFNEHLCGIRQDRSSIPELAKMYRKNPSAVPPVLVHGNTVIDGHSRVLAAMAAGVKSIFCTEVTAIMRSELEHYVSLNALTASELSEAMRLSSKFAGVTPKCIAKAAYVSDEHLLVAHTADPHLRVAMARGRLSTKKVARYSGKKPLNAQAWVEKEAKTKGK